ncbi:MAG: hypothetical protein GTN93_25480, partial [Anaerolineae bacterium]|nr:hypothetical protein [Anaerolineae bacterium]
AGLPSQAGTTLFDLCLTDFEAAENVPVPTPEWWKGFTEVHRISYDSGARMVKLWTGREELGGTLQLVEIP